MKTILHNKRKNWLILLFSLIVLASHGQTSRISGIIKNAVTDDPIPYANVLLLDSADSTMIEATVSNFNGSFEIESPKGVYILEISHMSFKPSYQKLKLAGKKTYKMGALHLKEKSVQMEKLVIYGERRKAKQENDKTTFYINKKMSKASYSGIDIIKNLPGIHMNFMQKLSLQGNENILLLVNGKKRDIPYLRQISAKQVDKVEIIDAPGSQYEADVDGVINILLKKKQTGISGHIYAEIPTQKSEAYLFPNYSLHYGNEKMHLHTSYNGEISHFNITKNSLHTFDVNNRSNTIHSIQNIIQDNWSHRFDFNMDYYPNPNNQINVYAHFNPYSQEHDGIIQYNLAGTVFGKEDISVRKEDTDRNLRSQFSVFYKHSFSEKNNFTLDISHQRLNAKNATRYTPGSGSETYLKDLYSITEPNRHNWTFKMNQQISLTEQWSLNTGINSTYNQLKDAYIDTFRYTHQIYAGYGKTTVKFPNFKAQVGLRAEYSYRTFTDQFKKKNIALLPNLSIRYSLGKKQDLKFGYNRTLRRPYLYQLNPAGQADDPITLRNGNPQLRNEPTEYLFIGYSALPDNNFLSARMFYKKTDDAINILTFINEKQKFEKQIHNLGSLSQWGLQMSGALKLSSFFSLQPFAKFYKMQALPNETARNYGIKKTQSWELETGLSAILSLKYGMTASLQFHYSTPHQYIQSRTYSDALYMLSFEKSFDKKLKIGMTTGLPFSHSFIYHGLEADGPNFQSRQTGRINLSGFTTWLKLSYQFSSGKKIPAKVRTRESNVSVPQKGF